MTGRLIDLLRGFERELIEQERGARDFSERFPAEAGRLGMAGGAEHPQTQGILDAISFTNARTADRLERNQQQLAQDLAATLLPHMDRPSPPATIARFDFDGAQETAWRQAALIPRGTSLFAHQHQGVRCEFRTVYDVSVAPVQVADAHFTPVLQLPYARSGATVEQGGIAITLASMPNAPALGALGVHRLRLYIDADTALAAALRDTLFMRVTGAWLQVAGSETWRALSDAPLLPVGFGVDDAVLPYEARSHPAYHILSEYFLYPEKFNFFDIDLDALVPHLPPGCHRVTLHLGVRIARAGLASVLAPLARRHLALSCTPIVNLFKNGACPIYQDYTKTEYALLASMRHAHAYEIYSVDAVSVTNRHDKKVTQCFPYYSLKHGLAGNRRGRYWSVRRDAMQAVVSPGYEMAISFVDSGGNRFDDEASTVSIDLTCTNRDWPSRLPVGATTGDLVMAHPLGGFPIRMLRQPGRSYRFPDGERWRLISHLSVSLHSLLQDDMAILMETLALYDLPQSAVTRRQIAGLRGIAHQSARVPWSDDGARGFLWGVEITLQLDEEAYEGSGLHVFVQVLDHLFGLSIHVNSFVRLIVVSYQTGKELLRCKPRNGFLTLL